MHVHLGCSLEWERGKSDWVQHGQLPFMQESMEVLCGTSHILPIAFPTSSQEQPLHPGVKVQIQVSALLKGRLTSVDLLDKSTPLVKCTVTFSFYLISRVITAFSWIFCCNFWEILWCSLHYCTSFGEVVVEILFLTRVSSYPSSTLLTICIISSFHVHPVAGNSFFCGCYALWPCSGPWSVHNRLSHPLWPHLTSTWLTHPKWGGFWTDQALLPVYNMACNAAYSLTSHFL